jgi:membrane protein implicated in regulation of membrane protease activity
MPKILLWLQSLRTLFLAFRVIAFEKTDASVFVLWAAVTIFAVAVFLMHSLPSAAVALIVMAVLFFVIRGWARRNRFRLIRTADRVEYADADSGEHEYRQRFDTGVVLQRLNTEDVKRTGEYDTDLMEESRWFFVVRSPQKTRIVPSEWIVGIELEPATEGM